MKRTFEYTPLEDAPLRFTVATASVMDSARYEVMRREALQLFREQTGAEAWEAAPDGSEAWALLNIGISRAYMLACTRKYERQDGADWQAWERPAAWDTVEGFANGVDAELYTKWQAEVLRCNPRLFSAFDDSDEGKVDGGDNATA